MAGLNANNYAAWLRRNSFIHLNSAGVKEKSGGWLVCLLWLVYAL